MPSVHIHPDHAHMQHHFKARYVTSIGRHQKKSISQIEWDFKTRSNDQMEPIDFVWIRRVSNMTQCLEKVLRMKPSPIVLLSQVHVQFMQIQIELSDKKIRCIPVPEDDARVVKMIERIISPPQLELLAADQPDINQLLVGSISSTVAGLGNAKGVKLLKRFGSLRDLAEAPQMEIQTVVGKPCGKKLKQFLSEPL